MDLDNLQRIIRQEQREENINALFEDRDPEKIAYRTDLSNGGQLVIDQDGLSLIAPPNHIDSLTISFTASAAELD